MPRLIDADALKTELMLAAETLTVAYEAHGEGHVVHSEDIIKCDKMNELLRSFPTIDAVPVVHGHWTNLSISVSGHASAECSVCGSVVYDNFSDLINYCPNCGSDMRG